MSAPAPSRVMRLMRGCPPVALALVKDFHDQFSSVFLSLLGVSCFLQKERNAD